ncbi:MAG TPA: PKD domain-containing protein [Pyrinomonadaceae bacterium]|nr:PKD domain-containing protein [Pyrinomonadaceae bacterium]
MNLSAPTPPFVRFIRLIQRTHFEAASVSWRLIFSQLLSLALTYALLLQLVPHVATAAPSQPFKSSLERQAGEPKADKINSNLVKAGAEGAWNEMLLPFSGGDFSSTTITDAVISRHKPTLNSGRIEGTLRVLSGESFTINGSTQITSDLYLAGTPTIQLTGAAQYGGTASDSGADTPSDYAVSLTGSINLPGRIHNHVDAIQLPTDFPASVPMPAGTRTVTVRSQSEAGSIGDWQTVRDLNVTGAHITLNVPPGNYGTFTVNGNSQLNFTAGTYNFSNTFNLDGSASVRATGLAAINVGQNLTVNSGAVVLGSYTSPGDLHLNVLGSLLKVNGSSQVSGLVRAYNGTVILSGTSQVRGQIIADSLTLTGGKVIGAVWPALSGSSLSIFGPRRFDRTTGSPNQYVEQFALPAGITSPYTLHIQNGDLNGANRVSSATIKVNGVDVLTPSGLNQNVAGLDRTVTLAANNQLDVLVASDPGSYLIINITSVLPVTDTTPPTIAITSPVNNSATTATQTNVSGTAADVGPGASGVAHVYVNNSEAAYNSADGTWTIANVALALGANQLVARAVDQASNQTNASITITRQLPTNLAPTTDAGPDQTLTLPQTASLHGTATDDGLPDGSTLTTTWSKSSGPGAVTFTDDAALETTASFSVAGTYELRLTASDGTLSTSDDATITVQPQNQPPTVTAGPNQTIALPHTATLNGTVTDDGLPAGGTLSITWIQMSGPGAVTFGDPNLADTIAAFSEPGSYVLRLSASDSELTSKSDVTITVQPENHPPTVSAGQDQIISLPNAAQLSGAASDDGLPVGSSLSIAWSMVSGPGSVVFDSPNITATHASFGVAGIYVLRLTATDGELSSSADVSIAVTPRNQAPTVAAGPDQTITLPAVADLNGTVGDDGLPLGSSVSTLWSQISGPGTVTFANPNVTVTTASFSAAGVYVLRLAASDSELTTFRDLTVNVIAENHAPTVNAGTDQAIALPHQASLNGSVADDGLPAGSTLTVVWSKVSGPGSVTFANPQAAITTATFSIAGPYVLRLTASDSELTTSDEVTVIVDPENLAPIVSAGSDQTITLPADASLNGNVTDDGWPRGSSVSITWSKVSGPGTPTFAAPNAAVTAVSFSQAGVFVLRLTASDSQLSSSHDVQVTVIPENHAPTANAGTDSQVTLPNAATLNGSVSDDGLPAGSTLTSSWSKINGPGTVTFGNANVTITTAAFSEAGTYVLRLTANDSELTSSDDVQIIVIPENHAPSVNAGTDQEITLPNTASLSGTVTDDGLPTGSTLTSVWSKVSGPGTVTFTNPTAAVATAAFSVSGTYVLRLTASDTQLSTSDDIQITVIPENHAPTANAGADQQITLPNTANLNGSVSDDGLPSGSTLISTWSKVSGPGTVTFGNPNVTVTTAAFSQAGTYVLRFTASDSQLSAIDDVQVTVIPENHAPTVNAGADQTIAFPASANLNGSVGDDGLPAGSSVSSSWSTVSGPGIVTFGNPSNTITTAAFSAPGSYVLRLTATDSALTTADDVTITVNDPRVPPVANFVVPESTGTAGAFVIDAPGFPSNVLGMNAILDDNPGSIWTTSSTTNQFVKIQFIDQQMVFIDRVRLQGSTASTVLKDFEVQVSGTTSADASFVTVLSGTQLNNGQLQEFIFPGGPVRAHFIKLLLKTNYGGSGFIQLGTFNPVAVGSVDSLISLPGLGNVARSQSPALVINGGAIYSSSYGGGANSADGLLGYNRGGFITSGLANEFAIVQLGGGEVYNLQGVRLATFFDAGFANAKPTAVKDFEVWVSATTPDPASFTKVLSATAGFVGNVQTFIFPNGSVPARYVKYVPLNNQGGGTVINTAAFDVILETGARVMSSSGEYAGTPSPPEAAFDGDSTTVWNSPNNVATNVSIKTALRDDKTQRVYGFRISGVNNGGLRGPKDIEISVSTTTTDDSAFTTVYTGTLAATFGPQEILLSSPVDAKYVQFFWKNGYSAQIVSVYELEVLAAPDRGSAVVAFSSGAGNVEMTLDLDTTNTPWTTPLNQNTSVWFKLLLPGSDLSTISHIALRPAIAPTGYSAPKDFQLQVSTTDAADASFTTVLTGTLLNSTQLQDFYFAPVQARYVRLLLLKDATDFRSLALNNFMVYRGDIIGTNTRFVDLSTDADGQVVSWAWDFGDGTTSSLKSPTHTFAQTGDYTVSLTVTDNSGLTNTHSSVYHVMQAIVPDFGVSPTIAHEGGESVRFTDLAELLSIPTALRVFDFGDGTGLSSQYAKTLTHTYQDSGVFHVTLRIGDPLGVSHTFTKDVTVLNVPPSVDIDPGKTLVWGETWTSVPRITDQSSIDRLSLQGQWVFGDGQTSQCVNCTNANATVTHSYAHPGNYNGVLTVTDKDGGVGSAHADFIVNKRPTAFIFQNPPAQSTGQSLVIHAQLVDTFANQPLIGKPVQFNLHGVSFNTVTGANGIAEVSVPLPSGTKIDLITGAFAEDEFYLSTNGVGVPLTAGGTPPSDAPSHRGTNFWLMFPYAYFDGSGIAVQTLYITSPVSTSGTVTIPGLNFTQNFTVSANTVLTMQLPFSQVFENNVITSKGIHVTSQQPVTVYGLNKRTFTSDAFLGLPVNTLGTDYYILTYSNISFAPSSELGVVATDNSTIVTITPSVTSSGHTGGVPFNVTLNLGQTYLLQNLDPTVQGDLSSTHVTSNKPIAVFAGHEAATIPAEAVCCADHLLEQLPPTGAWGKRFATVPLATRTKGDFFRFIAAEDGTAIYLNGSLTAIINKGQFVERILKTPTEIIATKPIMVAQYSTSIFYDSGTTGKADPFMMIIPPYSQFLNHYTVTAPATGFEINYANVVAPTASLGSITIDGAAIPVASFTPIGVSGFSGAQIPLTTGAHNFDGPASFGVFIYGYNQDEGYGYPGGMNMTATVPSTNVAVTPEASSHSISTQACVVATATDQNQIPLGGRTISFTVTGANPGNSSAVTDAAGQATFCYMGASPGTDQVVAALGSAQGTASIIWTPPNQPPVVNAGTDQSITLPAAANLSGSAVDDGLPANTLTVAWSKFGGPGNVTFANSSVAVTTATFSAPGVYVLRLTASDTALSASDDVQITVNPAPINQAPTANAGSDQSVTINGNLIANGSNEDQLVGGGEIPGWMEVQGTNWIQATSNSGSGFPNAQRGSSYFFASDAPQAELRQDVDVSAFAPAIAAGTQQFEFKAYLRSAIEAAPDSARVVVEYRDATNTNVIATLDSGEITSTSAWHLTEDTRTFPLGTGWVRVRLIGTRNTGATNDAFFDSITLRSIGSAAVKLNGTTTDDGLPAGSSMSANWTTVSGPATVTFTNPNVAASAAYFVTPGTYVLRLTASDGQLSTSDDVTINVAPANQAPVVSAGANQTITLPSTASLSGTVNDDGLPSGSSVSVLWSKVSGPGTVTFANANQTATTASFSAPGNYVLRLTADDTEYEASADVTITVNPEVTQTNQPPVVNAGPNQTIALPTDTVTLNGSATDDGLPAGSTLTVTWSKISGPGTVTFGNANSAVTTAQFSAAGSYVLRLSASDGAYLVSADVGVTLAPQNYPPTSNAGPDQTTLLSQPAQLIGSASDDGLPAGSNLTTTWSAVSGPAAVTFDNPNVTITSAHFTATGTYVLRLTASDGQLSAIDDLTITVIDNLPPPVVEITAPADGGSVTEPSIVTGTVSGGAWQLEYSLGSDDNADNRVWTQFASGNGPISNGSLGTIDPTMMLNGLFDIRLSATDSYGQITRTKVSVIVERNLKVGNFTVSFSDLNIPVAGVPMEVTRTYDSRDKRVGDFGFGWSLGLKNIRVEKSGVLGFKWFETVSQEVFPNYCVEPTGSHVVSVTFPGGKVFKFQAQIAPHCQRNAPITGGTLTFTPMAGTHGTLETIGSAEVLVAGSVPGPVQLFGLNGGVDIFNSFVFKYTAEDGTAYVIDQRTRLQSIADTNNNSLTIGSGGIIHSSGKSITFARDTLGRITSITDPNGNSQTYTYDTNGDLVSFTDNENNTSTYTYDANHRLLTIHDPRGIQPIRNDYDADGRLISHTDGFGKVITYVHDLAGRIETVTDRLGHATIFQYDERGNVLNKTDARGGVTAFTYDANDNVLTETNALGKTTTYTYDTNDHRASITDPLNNVTQFTYNGLGKVLTTTDPLGHVTTNTYNAAGNLLTTKDALHNITSYTYSVFDGQRVSMTDALNHTTHYAYTSGYLTKETDALGHDTFFGYDANGNRASQTVTRTNAQGQLETITTSYEYDKLNRLKKTTFADGSFTQVEYNAIGQQSATVDQLGHRTEFTYDDMGRMTRTDYPDGTHDETTYDAEGRRLTSKDRAGHVTSYTYDELGRLTKTTFTDGTFTTTAYDAAGQVLTTTDARGNVTHFEYDSAGRRTKVKNALSQESTFSYDANGNQLSMTDALSHTTTYEYDLNNRRTKTVYADSSFNSVGYDVLGRSVSKTDQAGKTTQFTYDALGRLTKVKDALNQETTYGHNEIGQQISQIDANNHTTQFEYDQLSRRVKRILPGGEFETYAYDNGGNLLSKTDFNGKTTTLAYDTMRRLLSKTPDASLSQPTVSFTYNATGQRATMSDATGATVYSYDARNRLSSKQTAFGTLIYTYNEAGGLLTTRSSNANGVSVDYSYDSLNRMSVVKDNNLAGLNGGVTNYTYDTVGNLQNYQYPNGVTSSYAYNSLNRLTTMTVGTPVTALASYSYTLGAAGNRTAATELGGRTVNYTYDDLYRLTSESIANDPHGVNGSASYSYDPVGNRLNRSSSIASAPSQGSTYDSNDRLASDTYDNNGNTITANSNNYAYDFENHLTSLNGGSVRYIYDGDGNRVTKTIAGVTTNYLVDPNNPTGYAQVVDELQSGAVVRSFTYGHNLISQRIVGGSLSFYQYDGHGSVRQLTNASGAITDAYDYDAFGNLINRSGTTPNDYLYSGEQFDASLGFYNLRARYMNPESGRFLSVDTFEGSSSDPLSLHKYLYVSANPINGIDPTGNTTLAELNQTFADFAPLFNQSQLQALGVKAALATAAVSGGLTLGQAIGATAFAVSLAVAIGSIAMKELKDRAEKDKYEFVTVYRWTNELAPAGFRIKDRDDDGYLSVFRDLASQRPGDYNVPMVAMFKKPINQTEPGDLIVPRITGVRVWWTPLSGDPNGHLHYSLDYPGGRENQGDIPDRLSEHARRLGLQPGEFRDPYKDLR